MSKLFGLKKKLENREKIVATTISNIAWSGILQKIKHNSLDFVLFDLEHGTLSTENVEEMLRVARMLDIPSVVRVQDTIPLLISKTIDMGADGLLIPRVESLEQANLAIQSLRFFPRGKKGCGGFSFLRSGEQFHEVNDNRLIFLQIESPAGIDNLDEILQNLGTEISGIIVGPYDMSILSGVPLDIKCDKMMEQIRKVLSVCAKHGKSCGIFCDTPEDAVYWREIGMNILWTGSEISFMCRGLNQFYNILSEIE